MQENYKILGVDETATIDEINDRYEMLKARYQRERFYEGEIGNDAAKNLTKLETAYKEIMAEREHVDYFDGKKTENFDDVKKAIEKGDLNFAQSKLDDISERSAEWHYLQAVIFYKKNWNNESKKQLEIAIKMDPSNEKYSNAYTKLNNKIYGDTENTYKSGNARYVNQEPQNNPNQQMGGDGCTTCLNCASAYCCMRTCCNC